MNTDSAATTHAELRAQVAFVGIKYYKLASLVDVHPSRLSQYLHGHLPIPNDVAARIRRALDGAPAK
jgi:DNA-binding transcriptional regulator YdaS (Cro superfamily)